MATLLGISTSLPSLLTANAQEPSFDGSVLIIGAGAAGMSAGYLLQQQGIEFQILEASSNYGGRMKRTTDFADFPIPLGAEWLHRNPSVLDDIVNDATVDIRTQLQAYSSDDIAGYFEDGELYTYSLEDWNDLKFIDSTWFDFFEEYIVPSIEEKMQFNTQILSIDYGNDGVVVTDQDDNTYEADKIIMCVPLKILQDGDISFNPSLPRNKARAIENANIWGGIKVFIEFTEAFYPVALEFPDSYTNDGQRLYYDAAYGQDTDAHILGLFSVGEQAETYQALEPEIALRDYILAELDDIFDGRASASYVKHIVQNWNDEPFIRAAYLADVTSWRTPPVLSRSIDQKLFFAGTAFTNGEDWGSVHNATQSARRAVEELLS
ncbi:MAG: FAD-dependent oxidoreductase [Chloroflexota bacterium]